jgi:chaperone BCS1
MNSLYDGLVQALHSQFFSGGLVLLLTGSLIALLRKAPEQVWRWLLRRFTIAIDVSNDDPLFAWLTLWLAEQPYSQRARILTGTSERDEYGRSSTPDSSSKTHALPQILLTPAPGNHLVLYKRRLVWLSRERKEPAPGSDDSFSFWKREVFTIRSFGRSQTFSRSLLEDARAIAHNRRHRKVEIFVASYENWQSVDERDTRPLSSVYLPDGVIEMLGEDIQKFLDSQPWYVARGIPWRRGYMFHGIPGTGKTSTITALAGHFRMNLYILNVSNARLTDDGLSWLLTRVPARSMLLLEDMDSAFQQRVKAVDVDNKLSFSGLLNALDGAASKDGTLVFMTTNHLERLDDALVRPGRVDVPVEFTYATREQAIRMFGAFYFRQASLTMAEDFAHDVAGRLTMAEIQQHLLRHRDSAESALETAPVARMAAHV